MKGRCIRGDLHDDISDVEDRQKSCELLPCRKVEDTDDTRGNRWRTFEVQASLKTLQSGSSSIIAVNLKVK